MLTGDQMKQGRRSGGPVNQRSLNQPSTLNNRAGLLLCFWDVGDSIVRDHPALQ